MQNIVLVWNLKKDIEAAKNLVHRDKDKVLKDWYGEENYNSLLLEYPEGGYETANNWVNDSFVDSLDDIVQLLQMITNETQDNPLIQKRLKAVGFTPQK